jgi:hypothetical protein
LLAGDIAVTLEVSQERVMKPLFRLALLFPFAFALALGRDGAQPQSARLISSWCYRRYLAFDGRG